MIRKLEELTTTLAKKLGESLRNRIAERRTCLTSVLIYLRDYVKYEEDLEDYARDETFKMSQKVSIRKEIKKLIKRLHCKTQYYYHTQESSYVTEPLPSTSAAACNDVVLGESEGANDDVPLSVLSTAGKSISLQEELLESLTALKKPNRSTNSANSLEILIKKEMNLYEAGGVKDETLDMLCFLRSHFQK
ncbi:unnamed protein product [Parnassius mnemosyne]|uniref:Interleukin-6 n=1 Tax=Parnassius mnemosyne TaxID=213953 RepID=A0AAV1LZT7_9NEOP